MGELYKDQGKLDDAETMYQRTLMGFERALGPAHRSTLETVNHLGDLYKDQGKLAEAEAMRPGHKSTLEIINNLKFIQGARQA